MARASCFVGFSLASPHGQLLMVSGASFPGRQSSNPRFIDSMNRADDGTIRYTGSLNLDCYLRRRNDRVYHLRSLINYIYSLSAFSQSKFK